jgi:hypothetical protein
LADVTSGTSGDSDRASVFARHRGLTLVAFVLLVTWIADFVCARVILVLRQRQDALNASYRIRVTPYHHDLRPNALVDGVAWGPTRYSAATNSLGFRDERPRPVAAQTKTRRLLFMGDSFTEAVGVEFNESFAGLVAEALRTRQIEVLNAAVVSYSPVVYLRKTEYLLENRGLQFSQMIVLLDISDIEDETSYAVDSSGNVERTDQQENATQSIGWAQWAKNNSLFLQGLSLAREALSPAVPRPWPPEDDRCRWTVDAEAFERFGRRGLESARANMTRLRDLLRSRGISLALVVYPWPCQMRAGDLESRQVRFWREWADEQGTPFLSLFGDFIPATPAERENVYRRTFIQGDVHWNTAGHRLVADALLKSGLIEGTSPE